MKDITVTIPEIVYDIYADAAKRLEGYSVAEVLSGALQAYAQYLLEEIVENGEL